MSKKLSPFEINPWVEKKSYTQEKAKELLKEERGEEVEEFERKESLEKLFDKQVQVLIRKGCPEAAGMDRDAFLKHILPLKNKLKEIPKDIPKNNIPFLIITPDKLVDIEKQMSMVEFNDQKGVVSLDLVSLEDEVKTPSDFYLISDVEDGRKMLNISPEDAIKEFEKEGKRRALTALEGIALAIHYPELMRDRYIDLAGSYCSGADNVPYLVFDWDRPRLHWGRSEKVFEKGGSASCSIKS